MHQRAPVHRSPTTTPASRAFVPIAAGAVACVASSALAQSLTLIGWPSDGGTSGQSHVYGLSADGRSAAGYSFSTVGTPAFLWTADGGRNDFGRAFLPTIGSVGYGISGDGLTVVGSSFTPGAGTPTHAYTWSQAGGYHELGSLPGYLISDARDASFDGSVVVGTLTNGSGSTPQAFRWTQSGGMQGLGVGTTALQVSGDGSKVVGVTGPSNNRPFVWTSGAGIQFLPTVDGTGAGRATGINNNGSIIVGESGFSATRPTMWVNGVAIDLSQGSDGSIYLGPTCVSDTGAVVAGLGQVTATGQNTAAVWTSGAGIMRLSDYLTANGVSIPVGTRLFSCTAVSADGLTFAGDATDAANHQIGFVATIPASCPADLDNDGNLANGGTHDHAVDVNDLFYFLAAFEAGSTAADLDNGTGTGTHDGAVTVEDLLFFLTHFEAGC